MTNPSLVARSSKNGSIRVDINRRDLMYALEGLEWPDLALLFVEIATGETRSYDEYTELDLRRLGELMIYQYRIKFGLSATDPTQVSNQAHEAELDALKSQQEFEDSEAAYDAYLSESYDREL